LDKNRTVLVIDDEAHIRRVIELKLKNKGFQVLTARNGKEGLDMIRTQHPDAVVSDIMMPEMDGKTLCEQVNVLKKQRPFLTIIMTCRISSGDESWASEMQDTLFMEKPFSPNRLVECIEQYFRDTKQ